MKNLFLLLFIIVFFGCSDFTTLQSINPGTEKLEESQFSLRYISDWRVVSTINEKDPDRPRTTYKFYHPRNRKCFVSIELIKLPVSEARDAKKTRELLAEKIRFLQNKFGAEGYKGFKVITTQSRIGQKTVKKLYITANKGNLVREYHIFFLEKQYRICLASYQWFSTWNSTLEKHLTDMINSIRL